MKKYVAIVLQFHSEFPELFIIEDDNHVYRTFKDEDEAEIYVNKRYKDCCVLYGVVPEPTPIYKLLRKQRKQQDAKKER